MIHLAAELRAAGESGSLLSLICDSGDRYRASYQDPSWVATHIGDTTTATEQLELLLSD